MRLAILLVFLGTAGFFLYRSFFVQQSAENAPTLPEQMQQMTPSTHVTSEMTIPSLRSRSYESQLGELQQNAQKATYTSYLTSYTSDGLHINALITKPKGEMPDGGWPAIVFVHGYIPPSLYQTTSRYVDYVDYLARSGYVVFKIDLRGHGKSEGIPTGSYYSPGYVVDTLSAITALRHTDFVNSDRIGLWGHSMAGNIVMRSLAAKPTIKATAIWAGAGYTYSDLQVYRIHDNSYRPPTTASPSGQREQLFARYGQFSEDNPFWKTVAPTNYLGDIKGAIALFHAKDDTVVSIEYSRNLNRLLDATEISHEMHEYPSGGHNITGVSFSKAMQATVEFYKKYL